MSAVADRPDSSTDAGVDGSAWTFSGAFNSPDPVGAAAGVVERRGRRRCRRVPPAGRGGAVTAAGGGRLLQRVRRLSPSNNPSAKVPVNSLMPPSSSQRKHRHNSRGGAVRLSSPGTTGRPLRRLRSRGDRSVRLDVGVRGGERRQRRAGRLDPQQRRERREIDVEPARRSRAAGPGRASAMARRVADQERPGGLARDGLERAEPARDVISRDPFVLGRRPLSCRRSRTSQVLQRLDAGVHHLGELAGARAQPRIRGQQRRRRKALLEVAR